MKQRTLKIINLALLGACIGLIAAKLHAPCYKENSQTTPVTYQAVDRIVDTVLIRSRYAIENAQGKIQMQIGPTYSEQINNEPVITLEFIDENGTKVGVPFPKHEIIDNIGKLNMVAQHLSNIFQKEIVYI